MEHNFILTTCPLLLSLSLWCPCSLHPPHPFCLDPFLSFFSLSSFSVTGFSIRISIFFSPSLQTDFYIPSGVSYADQFPFLSARPQREPRLAPFHDLCHLDPVSFSPLLSTCHSVFILASSTRFSSLRGVLHSLRVLRVFAQPTRVSRARKANLAFRRFFTLSARATIFFLHHLPPSLMV